jgi:hypothetical protein
VPIVSLAWSASDGVDPCASGGGFRAAYGAEIAFVISSHEPGNHDTPHRHDYEQITHVRSGEIWFYVAEEAYRLAAGDTLRIPRGALHWSWVKADEPCTCYEVFAPVPALPMSGPSVRALLAQGERSSSDVRPGRVDGHPSGLDIGRIEGLEPVFGAAPVKRSQSGEMTNGAM